MKMTFQEIRIIATGSCITNQLRDVNTEVTETASFLDLYLEFDDSGQISTTIYDKRDDFNFNIIYFPNMCSNISASPAYGVYISPCPYTFSLYENPSFIIFSAETEYISTRSWYRHINCLRDRITFLSKCLYQVRVITVFTVFRLLTDFVCLYNYEF
jgi:hypothetical protein